MPPTATTKLEDSTGNGYKTSTLAAGPTPNHNPRPPAPGPLPCNDTTPAVPMLTVKVMESGPNCHSKVKSPLRNTLGLDGGGTAGDVSAGVTGETIGDEAAETLGDASGESACTVNEIRAQQSSKEAPGKVDHMAYVSSS